MAVRGSCEGEADGGEALVVKGTTYPVTIEDVYFEGAAGSGYEDGGAGKNSVAGFVTGATRDVVVNRGGFKANAGADGQGGGESLADWGGAAPTGNNGTGAGGGPAQPLSLFECANGSGMTRGGAGGGLSGNGTDGEQVLPVAPTAANDGARGTFSAGTSKCENGHDGAYGVGGRPRRVQGRVQRRLGV